MAEREYVVTLKNFDDLEGFYHDMENPGSSPYTPNRVAVRTQHLPSSRNTNYLLTYDEANLLANDPRVLAVELTPEEQGIKISPMWTQTSACWDKNFTLTSSQSKNWGLLRCTETKDRNDWGGVEVVNHPLETATISTATSGLNVDVVIVDGYINPNHPEFAVNNDGSGGSRIVQYNWYQHKQAVEANGNGTFVYGNYTGDNNKHGCHVGGIVAGNTQGWAKDAKIYNISPYNEVNSFLQYIKAFHNAKPINPNTGVKNPTITNHSYGFKHKCIVADVSRIYYRGVAKDKPSTGWTNTDLADRGIFSNGTEFTFPIRNTGYEADLTDLMAAGVICIGAAGNDYHAIANPSANTADDYNNYVVENGTTYYYNRGTTTATPGMICVGASDSLALPYSSGFDTAANIPNELKLYFSCAGPRVDVYAPGSRITSSVNVSDSGSIADSRNNSYHIAKLSGTSMASPQVTGVLALWAQDNPRGTQAQAMSYITSNAKTNKIFELSQEYYPLTVYDPNNKVYSLQGGPNRYLWYTRQIVSGAGPLIDPNVELGKVTMNKVTFNGITIT